MIIVAILYLILGLTAAFCGGTLFGKFYEDIVPRGEGPHDSPWPTLAGAVVCGIIAVVSINTAIYLMFS